MSSKARPLSHHSQAAVEAKSADRANAQGRFKTSNNGTKSAAIFPILKPVGLFTPCHDTPNNQLCGTVLCIDNPPFFVSSNMAQADGHSHQNRPEVQKNAGRLAKIKQSRETQNASPANVGQVPAHRQHAAPLPRGACTKTHLRALTQTKISLRIWQGNLPKPRRPHAEISSVSEIKRKAKGLHVEA